MVDIELADMGNVKVIALAPFSRAGHGVIGAAVHRDKPALT